MTLAGHVAAGGLTPDESTLLLAIVLTGAGHRLVLARRERSCACLVLALGVAQVLLHLAFGGSAGPIAGGAAASAASLASAGDAQSAHLAHHAAAGPGVLAMVLGHGAAAVVLGWFLRQGEQVLWAAARRAVRAIRALDAAGCVARLGRALIAVLLAAAPVPLAADRPDDLPVPVAARPRHAPGRHHYRRPGQRRAVPLTAQQAAVEAAYPGKAITAVQQGWEDRSTFFTVDLGGDGTANVYVNPYTGKVLGALENGDLLSNIAVEIHGKVVFGKFSEIPLFKDPIVGEDFLVGSIGDRIIELACCWAIVMTLTGYYLFFRGRSARLKRVAPGAKAAALRHQHGVVGATLGAGVLLLVVSGLPWTGLWGGKVQQWGPATASAFGARTRGRPPRSVSSWRRSAPIPLPRPGPRAQRRCRRRRPP